MKYAVVAAAFVGAVVAEGWESWSTTKSVEDPKTWSTWDPKDPHHPKPTTTTTASTKWETWVEKTSTTSAKCSYVTEISTTKCAPGHPDKCWPDKYTTTIYPEKCDGSWSTWEVPDKKTTTTSSAKCSYVTEIATSKCLPGHPDQCWPYKKTSTVYPEHCTEGGWENWNTVPDKKTTTTSAKCSYVTDYPVTKCAPYDDKICFVKHDYKTVYPEDCEATKWNTWTVPEKTTTAKCSYVTDYPVTKCSPYDDKKCYVKHEYKTVYPDNCDIDWNTWTVPEKTTTAKCSYVTEYPVTKCAKDDDKHCYVKTKTDTVYPTDCEATKWNTWTVPEKTTTAKCSYVTEYPVTKCAKDDDKHCYVKTKTETVYPTDCTKTGVYETTITVPGGVTITKTWNEWETKTPVVVTSVVKPGWEKDGWFGPEWPEVKDGQCVINVVTSYGYPTWVPAPEPTTVVKVVESTWATWSSEKPVTKVEESTKVVESTWAAWSSGKPVTKVVETTWATWSEAPSATPEVPKPKPGKGKAEIAPNGNKWAVTYGPYDASGKCKTVEVIKADVKKIKDLGFTTIRVYSTDCKTLEYVGDACREHGLKIIIGVFISKSGIEGAKPQVKDIVAWAQWDIVELIVIGNEAVFQGFCNADELVAFIKYCKAAFVAVGYTGPCTTTEPLGEWEKDSDKYCGVVDVVSANLYAYFNNECTADKAGEFIQSQITILTGLCKDKETYVMECGWPSEGQCNGKACAGKKEQAVAIKGIQDTCGAKIVFFNYEDEHWKQPGQYGVEQHWGVYDVFAGKGDNWSNWGKW